MLATVSYRELVQSQRAYFNSGATKPLAFRQAQLRKLRDEIQRRQEDIIQALRQDLGKPQFESYLVEIYGSLKEIDYAIKNLPRWLKPQRVKVGAEVWPSSAQVYPDPLGVVLAISPWNYPFSLAIAPLVGALAAGNCAVLKPSEASAATSRILAELLNDAFPQDYLYVAEGDAETSQALLAEKFDHIFFTGGTRIGQIIMEAAARQLTPVTLELGGKSPCIVTPEIDLKETAKRIIWGKFLNAGQTCIAPDYLLVQEEVLPRLLPALQQTLTEFYGADPAQSPDYGRMINDRQFERLVSLLGEGEILTGGQFDRASRYLAPTLVVNPNLDGALMGEEIFGPILPILTYRALEDAIAFVNARPKPLALYLFSRNRSDQEQVLAQTSAGGVCLNDTILQVGVIEMPFGGVGPSGIGAYHGKHTFDTFSHAKSVLNKPFWGEFNLRFPPYGNKLERVRKLFR
ncbi:MAG: aldehyde dehydrogenase [Cyanobacteriota bacterium]|jgi:aldehyde dehydrogenase (NAD+)